MKSIWTQIGNRFKNYGDKLIFEVNNEPRMGEDWGGNSTLYDVVNDYNEAGRAVIRATGGNNSSRLVLLPTYCASADSPKLYGWKNLSGDNMVAVSIHAYKPFAFAFEKYGHSDWRDSDYNELNGVFDEMNSVFVSKGIPVVIGEFGAQNKNNDDARVKYAETYAAFAKQYGMPCIWWDNHNFWNQDGEMFGIFDHNSCTFTYGRIADAMINVYGKGSSNPSSGSDNSGSGNSGSNNNYVSLFYGNSSASGWGQAVSVSTTRYGGNFDASNIKKGGHFYVEYSGNKGELELILQSMSGGQAWAKVDISESGSANGHYYAKYSYDNLVRAFGSNFSGQLDRIHVGATSGSVTVYSLCYDFNSNGYGYDESSSTSAGNSSSSSSSKNDKSNKGDPYVSVFWGNSTASNWGQAVSVMTSRNGGSFDGSKITSGGYFYVEYSGNEKQLEFILQSWSGAASWAKVNASDYGSANGHYFAKYSYDECVRAFGTSNFGGALDQIHVGAMNGSTTVYSVCYCYPQ